MPPYQLHQAREHTWAGPPTAITSGGRHYMSSSSPSSYLTRKRSSKGADDLVLSQRTCSAPSTRRTRQDKQNEHRKHRCGPRTDTHASFPAATCSQRAVSKPLHCMQSDLPRQCVLLPETRWLCSPTRECSQRVAPARQNRNTR